MLTPEQLLRLARLYATYTGLALSGVGRVACHNNRTFVRLADGDGITARTMTRAENFFLNFWPDSVAWPADIPRARSPWALPSPEQVDPANTLLAEDAE